MSEFIFDLGQEVKERVTGTKGIIMVRSQYTTGCNHYGIQQPAKKDGTIPDWLYFDENRLESTGKRVSMARERPRDYTSGPTRASEIPPQVG